MHRRSRSRCGSMSYIINEGISSTCSCAVASTTATKCISHCLQIKIAQIFFGQYFLGGSIPRDFSSFNVSNKMCLMPLLILGMTRVTQFLKPNHSTSTVSCPCRALFILIWASMRYCGVVYGVLFFLQAFTTASLYFF